MGHPWVVEARVEHGDARPQDKLHRQCIWATAWRPLRGYAVRVTIWKATAVARHDGVANFGIVRCTR